MVSELRVEQGGSVLFPYLATFKIKKFPSRCQIDGNFSFYLL